MDCITIFPLQNWKKSGTVEHGTTLHSNHLRAVFLQESSLMLQKQRKYSTYFFSSLEHKIKLLQLLPSHIPDATCSASLPTGLLMSNLVYLLRCLVLLHFRRNVLSQSFERVKTREFGISGGHKVNKLHPLLLKDERCLIQALWLKPGVSQGSEGCVCGHDWLQTAYDCSLQLFSKTQWCRSSNYFCSWVANKLLIACSFPRVGVVSLLTKCQKNINHVGPRAFYSKKKKRKKNK